MDWLSYNYLGIAMDDDPEVLMMQHQRDLALADIDSTLDPVQFEVE